MVVKGEYLTMDGNSRKIDNYIFMDYILSALVYDSTNLVIGINIQLQIMYRKRISKV
jgi:hypothetical protein